MVKRIAAFGEFFRVSVTAIQFAAGIRFLLGMFDSDETVRGVWKSMSGTLGQMGSVAASSGSPGMDGPPILLFSLCFILFGFFLFTVAPGATQNIENRRKIARSQYRSAQAGFFIPD
ncbi:MAG: hypothetical protein HGA31_05465 [Candidatus Moranbacteria bacterium]|nr:hypothetical protein [Candidatus Moranbacteria bacterium]